MAAIDPSPAAPPQAPCLLAPLRTVETFSAPRLIDALIYHPGTRSLIAFGRSHADVVTRRPHNEAEGTLLYRLPVPGFEPATESVTREMPDWWRNPVFVVLPDGGVRVRVNRRWNMFARHVIRLDPESLDTVDSWGETQRACDAYHFVGLSNGLLAAGVPDSEQPILLYEADDTNDERVAWRIEMTDHLTPSEASLSRLFYEGLVPGTLTVLILRPSVPNTFAQPVVDCALTLKHGEMGSVVPDKRDLSAAKIRISTIVRVALPGNKAVWVTCYGSTIRVVDASLLRVLTEWDLAAEKPPSDRGFLVVANDVCVIPVRSGFRVCAYVKDTMHLSNLVSLEWSMATHASITGASFRATVRVVLGLVVIATRSRATEEINQPSNETSATFLEHSITPISEAVAGWAGLPLEVLELVLACLWGSELSEFEIHVPTS